MMLSTLFYYLSLINLPIINFVILVCVLIPLFFSKLYNLSFIKHNITFYYYTKTHHFVSFLIFILLIAIIIFVGTASYKLMHTNNTQEVNNISLSMLQIFIAIFGIILAIIGFWSYASIKEHAVTKSTELTNKTIKTFEKQVKELMNRNAQIIDKQNSSQNSNQNTQRITEEAMKNE